MKLSLFIFLLGAGLAVMGQAPVKEKVFTHADTLRGSPGPERTWWDVMRYDITVQPDYDHQRLHFTQEGNVWHVQALPQKKGSIDVVEVFFSGTPHESTRPPWSGGWTFAKDSLGRPWMTVTCQGMGASAKMERRFPIDGRTV